MPQGWSCRLAGSALQVITTREFETNIELETNAILAIASRGNLKLMALVVGERHIIAKARYTGSCTSIERRLLERLCPILEGKPIIEASDHAVIDLEFNLRDHSLSAPVPGVIMPENTDSMFALPIQLVRDLLADYRRQTSFIDTENFNVRPCSPRWRRLSREQREAEVAAAVATFSEGNELLIAAIEGDRRVVFEIAPDAAKETNGSRLLQLEATIQAAILLVKLNYLEQWTQRRRDNARYYRKNLAGLKEISVPGEHEWEYAVNQYLDEYKKGRLVLPDNPGPKPKHVNFV